MGSSDQTESGGHVFAQPTMAAPRTDGHPIAAATQTKEIPRALMGRAPIIGGTATNSQPEAVVPIATRTEPETERRGPEVDPSSTGVPDPDRCRDRNTPTPMDKLHTVRDMTDKGTTDEEERSAQDARHGNEERVGPVESQAGATGQPATEAGTDPRGQLLVEEMQKARQNPTDGNHAGAPPDGNHVASNTALGMQEEVHAYGETRDCPRWGTHPGNPRARGSDCDPSSGRRHGRDDGPGSNSLQQTQRILL
ncbi:hypothetical protein ACQJBY_003066 [Aegilops geniculata]